MPSAERSAGGNFDSSTLGPPRGEPESATYSDRPSRETFRPRGRLPTGIRTRTMAASGSTTTISPLASALRYTSFGSGAFLQLGMHTASSAVRNKGNERFGMAHE